MFPTLLSLHSSENGKSDLTVLVNSPTPKLEIPELLEPARLASGSPTYRLFSYGGVLILWL